MSDDLISRKALLKQFIVSDSGRRIQEYDIDNFPITLSVKDVKDIIRKAPTVFDKEKVIGELNEKADYARNRWLNSIKEGQTKYWEGKENGIREAIEVIEKGGIE